MHALLTAHLARHHGLVATSQLPDVGLTRHQFEWLVGQRELVRIHRGVYRHAAVPVTLELRVRAGLLAVGDRGVLSHRAAIARHGVRNFSCALVEVTHRGSSWPTHEGLTVHRSRVLASPDYARKDGVWTTTPARSLIDVAGQLPPTLVARWAQQWIADRKVRLDDIAAAAGRAGNHPGARRLRPHLDELLADVDSTGEAVLGRILAAAGIPPELHVLVTTATGHTFELDWAYPEARLGLEMDGYGVHLRSAAAFDDDRWRRNELEIAGWTILNFTSRQCRRPTRVVDQVIRARAVSRTPD